MREDSGPSEEPDGTKAAEYVAELTGDLARIARDNRMHTLGYLLEMAQLEAQSLARQPRAQNARIS
jgi:hypothetical protein